MRSASGSPGISALLEPSLPKPHIEEFHLRIDEVISPHSAPRFLEAVIVLLVKVHEPADGLRAVFSRRHLVCRNAILKESVVRGHAPERSHEHFRDEDRRHRRRNRAPPDLFADRIEIVGDVVGQLLELCPDVIVSHIRAREPEQAVVLGLEDLLDDGRVHLVVLMKDEARAPIHSPARQVEGEVQAQIVVVRGRVGPRISKHAIAMLPGTGAPILIRTRILVEGLFRVECG